MAGWTEETVRYLDILAACNICTCVTTLRAMLTTMSMEGCLMSHACMNHVAPQHPSAGCRCYIYRLLVTGLIDEKIFQRQLYKGGLSGVVGDGSGPEGRGAGKPPKQNGGGGFSKEELRKLFSMNVDTDCDTRQVLSVATGGTAQLWTDARTSLDDPVLQAAVDGACVSFAWLEGLRGEGADSATAVGGCSVSTPCLESARAHGDSGGGSGSDAHVDSRESGLGTSEGTTCGSEGTLDLAEAMGLVDSDADDVGGEHARDLVLDSD